MGGGGRGVCVRNIPVRENKALNQNKGVERGEGWKVVQFGGQEQRQFGVESDDADFFFFPMKMREESCP